MRRINIYPRYEKLSILPLLLMTLLTGSLLLGSGIAHATATSKVFTMLPITGRGTVTPSPGTYTYSVGQSVTITAKPASGYILAGFLVDGVDSGALWGTASISITMNTDHTVEVIFISTSGTTRTLIIRDAVGGTTNPPEGVTTYNARAVVTLTAIPDSGYRFVQWNVVGGKPVTTNPITTTMNSDKWYQPVFAQVGGPTQYTLTVAKSGTGTGSVALSPAGGSYASGTVVTLTANPATGSSFTGWGGSLTGSANPATVTMNGNKAVTATFTQAAQAQYTLTVAKAGSGSGSVALSPAGGVYASGTVVTLTASPAAGSGFTGWGGSLTGSANPATVTMNGNKAVTATFTQATQTQYTVTVTTVGQGTVSKSPSQASYASGSTVKLTATPSSGWVFTGWSGSLSGSANPATLTVNGNKAVTATFTQTSQYALTVVSTGTGSGSITLSPAGGTYPSGTVVTLTATPATGSSFAGWSGALSGSANPTTITMNSAKTVTTTFTQNQSPSNAISYTIWTSNNLYYSRKESTGVVTSSTDLDSFLTGIMNTLSSAGGGVIHFNAGTYNSPYAGGGCLLYLAPNITLEGAGQTSTIMNNIDFAIGVPNVIIRDMGFTGPYHSTYLIEIYASASDIVLERLSATGIRDAWGVFVINPGDGGVIDGVKFIDLSVRDCDGYAISINGASMNGGLARNIEWTRCKVYQAGLKSTRKCDWIVGFDLTELARVENLHVKDCLAEYSWESGFHVEYDPLKTNVVIENCVSNYNGQKPLPPGGWMWGYGFLVSTGVTLINPQGTGNYGGLVFNNGGGAVVI